MFSVVNLPPIPISPVVYLPFVALFLCRREVALTLRSLAVEPAIQWLLAMFAVQSVFMLLHGGLGYAALASVARVVGAGVLVIVLASYAAAHPTRYLRLVAMLALFTGASMLWFLLELALPAAPLPAIRMAIYADIYVAEDAGIVETIRSGLTPFRHLLGYPIAAAIPLAFVPLVWPASDGRHSGKVTRAAALLLLAVSGVALVLSLQRSSFAAALVAVALVLVAARRGSAYLRAALVVALAASAGVALLAAMPDILALVEGTLFSKLQSAEGSSDTVFRLRLQLRALELLAAHPLGLPADGLTWVREGFHHTYARTHLPPAYDAPIAVHNAYLGPAIEYGLAMLLVTVGLLTSLGLAIARVLRSSPVDEPALRGWGVGAAAAAAGLLSFQAGLHNAGVPSLEPVTLVIIALVIAHLARRRLAVPLAG